MSYKKVIDEQRVKNTSWSLITFELFIFLENHLDMWFLYIFLNCLQKKPHANPTIINEKIKEIHILTVGGVPGISNFKSRASPP